MLYDANNTLHTHETLKFFFIEIIAATFINTRIAIHVGVFVSFPQHIFKVFLNY